MSPRRTPMACKARAPCQVHMSRSKVVWRKTRGMAAVVPEVVKSIQPRSSQASSLSGEKVPYGGCAS